ncbi:MAG: hypothetical protein GY797_39695 [Deltaproteobacteria bacterium]|nr:hypothetical protein [Deltaproteobacteria bacterium]
MVFQHLVFHQPKNLTMPINANWQAGFLLWLVGPATVIRLQCPVANLANRVIGGVSWLSTPLLITLTHTSKRNEQEQNMTTIGWIYSLASDPNSDWGAIEDFYDSFESVKPKAGKVVIESDVWGTIRNLDILPNAGHGIAFYHNSNALFPDHDKYKRKPRISLIGELLDINHTGRDLDYIKISFDPKVLTALKINPIVRDTTTKPIFEKCGMVQGSIATLYRADRSAWNDIIGLLKIRLKNSNFKRSSSKVGRKYGSGGEGQDHKKLKLWLSQNPHKLGLKNVVDVEIEHKFLSGDAVDIVFTHSKNRYTVVEVETVNPMPGAHQAIKYRALLCAERKLPLNSSKVRAILVAWAIPKNVQDFCKNYSIDYQIHKQ